MYKSNGFTLIEFLVAIVILMVGLLGLLQTINLSLQHNLTTQLRNEAVSVADDFMSREISKTFDLISTSTGVFPMNRKVSTSSVIYTVQRSGASVSNSKQINVVVAWNYKGKQYQHETTAVVSKHQ